MFKLIAAFVVVVGLIAIVYGPSRLWNSARAARNVASDEVDKSKSDVQLAAEVSVALEDLDKDVYHFADRLADVQERYDGTVRRKEQIGQQLAKQREILAKSKELLDRGDQECVIAGRRYTRSQVAADATARLAGCQQFTQELATTNEAADRLKGAVEEGHKLLTEAQGVRQKKVNELELLKARLANAQLLGEVNELTNELRSSPLGQKSELALRLEQFRDRVRDAERHVDAQGGLARTPEIVAWEKGADATDVSGAIGKFLADEKPVDVAGK